MRTIEKATAAMFVCGVLAFQGWATYPFNHSGGWYWPFVDYPMYSTAKLPGDNFVEHALALEFANQPENLESVSSGTGTLIEGEMGSLVLLGAEDLGIHRFTLYRTLDQIAQGVETPDESDQDWIKEEVHFLSRLIAHQVTTTEIGVHLLEREYRVGPKGLENTDPPWRGVLRWKLQDRLGVGDP